MHRRFLPSPAMVVAVVALVAALGGTGLAATAHRHRGSRGMTRPRVEQIVASYLKAHESVPGSPGGPVGETGAAGEPGPIGAPGAAGPAGPTTSLAPSGLTQTGLVMAEDQEPEGGFTRATINFPMRLSSAPIVEQMGYQGTSAHCKGSREEPTAAPGYLCLYLAGAGDAGSWGPGLPYFYAQNIGNLNFGSGPSGVMLTARAAEAGTVSVSAAWAVTAP